jgi:hypothetical protein
MADTQVRPRAPIRRFDVFAEYNRLKGLKHGLDQAHARGYGLWVAKVVASGGGRRAGRALEPRGEPAAGAEREHERPAEQEWHELSGEPQTDALFEHEIVQRMGAKFYAHEFAPAIASAFDRGERYESIRDAIRRDWSPAR